MGAKTRLVEQILAVILALWLSLLSDCWKR